MKRLLAIVLLLAPLQAQAAAHVITVTANFFRQDGVTAPVGTVTFQLSATLRDSATGKSYPAIPKTLTLDGSGHISTNLVANDDPEISPSGSTYLITEKIDGKTNVYNAVVPYSAAGGAIDLASLAPSSSALVYGVTPLQIADMATTDTAQTITAQKTFYGAGNTGVIFDATGASGSVFKLKMNSPPNGQWIYDAQLTSAGVFETGAWMTISGTRSGTPNGEGFYPFIGPTGSPGDPYMIGIRSDIDGPALQIRPLATANSRAIDIINDTGQLYALSVLQDGMLRWGNGATYASEDTFLHRAGAGVLKTDGVFQVAGRLDALGNISTQTLVDGNLVVREDLTTGSGATQFKNFGVVLPRVTVTYSASMTPDVSTGNTFVITATNGTAFTINNPANPTTGERFTYMVRNTSGGALGTATFGGGYKMSAWTQPANGNSRSIDFIYDGTNTVEVARTPSDVPN